MIQERGQVTGKCRRRRVGKDHLNLADWRVSVPTFQQPRSKDGGAVDFVEYVIARGDAPDQRVTLESPSRIGLPTAGDEDVIVALLYLAKEQGFTSDVVHFVPAQLLEIMGWPRNRYGYQRLKAALKRLKAVTVTYELTWYSRKKNSVEPVLITGILAEAKLVLRRGRPAADALPDSYVQWTKNFFASLQDGNLTNLDLDLYFSWSRPGTRQLYRHLNKVWHAGKKPRSYERDLKQLACGHLGMTAGKDLKRNFHHLVKEMESRGYLRPMDAAIRYHKVRPGVWRVRLELDPEHCRKTEPKGEGSRDQPSTVAQTSEARTLVTLYHRHRFARDAYEPRPHEIKRAEELLATFDAKMLHLLVPQVARTVAAKFGDDLYFGAAVTYFEAAAKEQQNHQRRREKQARRDEALAAGEADAGAKKHRLQKRRSLLLEQWQKLSAAEKSRHHQVAIEHAATAALRRRLTRRSDLANPPSETLEQMASDLKLSIGK